MSIVSKGVNNSFFVHSGKQINRSKMFDLDQRPVQSRRRNMLVPQIKWDQADFWPVRFPGMNDFGIQNVMPPCSFVKKVKKPFNPRRQCLIDSENGLEEVVHEFLYRSFCGQEAGKENFRNGLMCSVIPWRRSSYVVFLGSY